jgi:hypothetical protein
MAAKTRADYEKLQKDLQAIERTTKLYLADEGVDAENVLEGRPASLKEEYSKNWLRNDDPFWGEMYRAAGMAAGMRAEDANFDINAALGYVVY